MTGYDFIAVKILVLLLFVAFVIYLGERADERRREKEEGEKRDAAEKAAKEARRREISAYRKERERTKELYSRLGEIQKAYDDGQELNIDFAHTTTAGRVQSSYKNRTGEFFLVDPIGEAKNIVVVIQQANGLAERYTTGPRNIFGFLGREAVLTSSAELAQIRVD